MIDAFRIEPDGRVVGLYTDAIDLRILGHVRATRASWIEWDETAQAWMARLAATGERLGPFPTRAEAVATERRVLAQRLASLPLSAGPDRACPLPAAPPGPDLRARQRPRAPRALKMRGTAP